MSTEQMRARLCEEYPGDKWKKKVLSMSESQVVAIYSRCMYRGTLRRSTNEGKKA